MASPVYEVALFSSDEAGTVRMLGRSTEQHLVELVREHIVAARRRDLAQIEPPVRLVRADAESPREPESS